MATKSPVVNAITSLKDGAYKQAVANDNVESVAQYAIDNVAGFPDTVSDEAREQLNEGYRLRFNERNKPQQYAVVDGNYLLIDGTNEALAEAREKINIGVDYAYSFSQQQFGRLKNENPNLHAIIKGIRDKVSTYCSNRLSDLKRQARTILNRGKKRERGATHDFAHRVEAVLSDLMTKCKNAKARGDESADEKKLTEARIAFMVKWNAV